MANDKSDADDEQSSTSALLLQRQRRDYSLPAILLRWFIQVFGLAAAIIFGMFSVLSWSSSQAANELAKSAAEQASTANLLALASLCSQMQQDAPVGAEDICAKFSAAAFPALESALAPILPSATTTRSTTSSTAFTTTVTVTSGQFTSTSSAVMTRSSASTVTSAASYPTSTPPSADSSYGSPEASLGPNGKIALGVGLGVGIPLVLISLLTVWMYRGVLRRRPNGRF